MSSLTQQYKKWDNMEFEEDDIPIQKPITRPDLPDVSQTKYVNEEMVKKIKKIDKTTREVWQLYVRRLRVWQQASDDDGKTELPPTRPYRIILTNLFPLGRIINSDFAEPPHRFPDAGQVMNLILKEIMDPAKENGNPHRPDQMVFEEQSFMDELAPSLAALGIYADQLFAADGVPEYIQKVSDIFLEEMDGGVNYTNTLPGLTTVTNVEREQLDGYYKSAFAFYNAKCWTDVSDRQSFVLRAKSYRLPSALVVPEGHIFVSILGRDSGPRGIAIFYNQCELENRAKPEDLELLSLPKTRVCSACGKVGVEIATDMKRCTRCQTVFYCNADCQKKHWKEHKPECVTMENHPRHKDGKIIWGFRETSLIFQAETELPFGDLEDMDSFYPVPALDAYPFANTYRQGKATRPTASELLWIERALNASIECTKPDVDILAPNKIASKLHTFEITTGGKVETVEVINVTVLCQGDIVKKSPEEIAAEEKAEADAKEATAEPAQEIDETAASQTEQQVNEVD